MKCKKCRQSLVPVIHFMVIMKILLLFLFRRGVVFFYQFNSIQVALNKMLPKSLNTNHNSNNKRNKKNYYIFYLCLVNFVVLFPFHICRMCDIKTRLKH